MALPDTTLGRRGARGLAGMAAAALLAGCAAVGPDFQPPVPPAPASFAAWHGGDTALAAPRTPPAGVVAQATDARWATLLDDTLAQLLALAAADNLDVMVSATRLLQARALEASTTAQHGVQVSARGGVAREALSRGGAGTRLINVIPFAQKDEILDYLASPFSLYQAGFDASWELDLWGRVRRTAEAASAQTAQAQADRDQMALSVTAELVKAYYQLRALQGQLAPARRTLADGEQAAQLLAAQFEGGLRDDSALARQRLQNADAASHLQTLAQQEAAAINRITLLCGQQPGSLNSQLQPLPADAPDAAMPDLRLGLPSDVARQRPDIAGAEARLAAATANIGVAVADLYPRVTIGASFGFESLQANQLGDWPNRQWSIGPSLSIPVFDHGRRRATVELRERQQQEAAIAYRQTVLRAWHEIDDAIAEYVAQTNNLATARQRAQDAAQQEEIARARYARGTTDYLPVLAAATTTLQARQSLALGSGQARTALVAVYKALGNDGSLQLQRQANGQGTNRTPEKGDRIQ